MTRRVLVFVGGALLAVWFAGWSAFEGRTPQNREKLIVRISHFRPSIPATVQKARGNLERKLAPLGATVEWTEFKVTPDSALAASSGAVDLMVGGVEGGLSTIALGVPAKILASGPHGAFKTGWYTALLVRDDAPIAKLGDLRGKKIAVGRGGFAEAILALAVRRGGLRYPEDVEPAYLSSSDSRNAFVQGLVDAVLTLDPYVAQIRSEVSTRVLTDNEQLNYPTTWAVLVLDKFSREHPELLEVITQEFLDVGPWIRDHRAEVTETLSISAGFSADLWEKTTSRASYILELPTASTVRDLQYVADQVWDLGVLPKKLDVSKNIVGM